MILNAENSNISLWAYKPEYVKKNTLRYTLRYSFILSEAPGPLRYKFYAPVQFFTHFLVMILNAKNSKIIFWAYKPYYAKKTRSGTAPVQNYDNHHHHHHHHHRHHHHFRHPQLHIMQKTQVLETHKHCSFSKHCTLVTKFF